MRQRGAGLSAWRAGLLVLAVYAMLAQSFVGALAGPAMPAIVDGAVICLTRGSDAAPGEAPQAPAPHGQHDCVCPALCHGGLALAGRAPVPQEPARLAASQPIPVFEPASPAAARSLPPARGPPHAGFVRLV